MKSRYCLFSIFALIIVILFSQTLFSQNQTATHPGNYIKFVSVPPHYGQVNVAYTYTAKAVSTDTTEIIHYFAINSNQIGFAIDSVTGVVSWTPTVKGFYSIWIAAKSNTGEYAFQSFIVTVIGGNGIVQGRVTADTSGFGIPHIIIEVLQASNTSPTSVGYYSYAAITDDNGYYRISNIDPGSYKIRAVSPTPRYASQWYDGAYNAEDAKIIPIGDSIKVTPTVINFTLRGGVSIMPMVKVSGLVTDTNIIPIKPNANIYFVRYGFALNCKDTTDDYREYFNLNPWWGDFRLDGRSQHVYHAKSDSTGKYMLNLPKGTYIAYAKAPGYSTEFYNEKPDLLSANTIVLSADTAGINFTLAPIPPVPLGTIKGNVIDSVLDKGVPSRIIAYRDHWLMTDNYKWFRSYVVDTDSLGTFEIDSLLPGSYYILAVPLGNYAPAFYSNDTASIKWKKATRIVINGNIVDNINIYVRQIPSTTNGYTSISGTIRSSSASTSLSGALVYAYRNGSISGYAVTNDHGKYSINGLAPGNYTVAVDKVGFRDVMSKYAEVAYSNTGSPENKTNIDFNIDEATAVEQSSIQPPRQFMLRQNYPNPFNPSTKIEYTLNQSGIVTLKVYNLLGQEVKTLVDGYHNAGNYSITFNAQGLASGIYFYRLKSQNNIQTRKMILLQ